MFVFPLFVRLFVRKCVVCVCVGGGGGGSGGCRCCLFLLSGLCGGFFLFNLVLEVCHISL